MTWALSFISLTTTLGYLSCHAVSCLTLWVIMELMTISVLAALTTLSPGVTESCMKYYLVQTFGGLVFLFSSSVLVELEVGVVSGALLKLGVFPFGFWVVPVLGSQELKGLWALSVLMKPPGLVILAQTPSPTVCVFAMLNVVYGALAGVYFVLIKKLFAASSLSNTGWLCLMSTTECWGWYLMLYSALLISALFLAYALGVANHLSLASLNYVERLLVGLVFMSLAGVPPLSGFALKWLALSVVSATSGVVLSGLVVALGFSGYYYMALSLQSVATKESPAKPQLSGLVMSGLLTLNLTGLLVMAMI